MGSPIPDSPKEWAVAEGLKLGGRSNNHVNTIYSKQNQKGFSKNCAILLNLFKIQFVCELGFESYVSFGSNQQSQFSLKKSTPWSQYIDTQLP
jgi:hypothetical protein